MPEEYGLELGPDRKVRSISVDSNVILDLYEKYAADPKSKERAIDSKNLVFLLQVAWIDKIGIKAVETELAREEELLAPYKKMFMPSLKPSKEVGREVRRGWPQKRGCGHPGRCNDAAGRVLPVLE